MAVELLLVSLLFASFSLTATGSVGVCYGRDGNNLPAPEAVVALYQTQGITKMRIYEPFPDVLQALRGSNIEVIVGVPNKDLQSLAEDVYGAASSWVQTNVLNYYPSVNFKYIAMGNEITPVPENSNAVFAQFVLRAMTNVFNAGLSERIVVSASIDLTVIDARTNFPPSNARFRDDVLWFMKPILAFLSNTGAPILTSVYPYFARDNDPDNICLPYALFTKTSPEFTDSQTNLQYFNLFDAQLDALEFAMERILGAKSDSMHVSNIVVTETGWPKAGDHKPDATIGNASNIVVTETGWPKAGDHKPDATIGNASNIVVTETGWPKAGDHKPDATIGNACTYNRNVIRHVKNYGTPKRPGVLTETYLFAMFDENLKDGPETERNFGLFYPNKVPACEINFRA